MDRIAELLAPRGWIDGIFKVLGFVVVINLVNFVIEGSILGEATPERGTQILVTTAVGTPFAILAFLLMARLDHLKREMRHLAEHDGLTGLSNRRLFLAQADQHLKSGQGGLLLAIDADHFKRINDQHGHQVGDDCLVAIAERMRVVLRLDDLKARMGGEEFAAFIPGMQPDHGRFVADRLTEEIRASAHGGVRFTVSVGIAEAVSGMSLSEVYSRADQALYIAKHNGRGRAEIWQPEPITAKNVRPLRHPA